MMPMMMWEWKWKKTNILFQTKQWNLNRNTDIELMRNEPTQRERKEKWLDSFGSSIPQSLIYHSVFIEFHFSKLKLVEVKSNGEFQLSCLVVISCVQNWNWSIQFFNWLWLNSIINWIIWLVRLSSICIIIMRVWNRTLHLFFSSSISLGHVEPDAAGFIRNNNFFRLSLDRCQI